MVILYVDPNAAVRSKRAALLAQAGHTVHEVDDAQSAAKEAEKLPTLDILITEGFLGGDFSGFDLRDAIRAKFPDVRCVVTSRYEISDYAPYFQDSVILSEPLDESALIATVSGAKNEPQAAMPAGEAALSEAPPLLAAGAQLGNYVIKERLYGEQDSETYLALQNAVNREVALVLLRPELLHDAAAVEGFLARSRVKAAVTHPRVAPLFEAQQMNGWMYYTREMPHGRSLDALISKGAKFGEKVLADVIAGVSEAMGIAESRGIHYRMPTARDVFVDEEHQASIVNVFRPSAGKPRDYAADTASFLKMLRPLCASPKVRHLIDELIMGRLDWVSLRKRAVQLQELHRQDSLLQRADSKEAHEIAAARSARSGVSPWAWAGLVLATIGAVFVVHQKGQPAPPAAPLPEDMVRVPAGEFVFQKAGEVRTLPEFWIDKYEVTIAQYEEFLNALEADPGHQHRWDHSSQPKSKKNHKPGNWDDFLSAVRTGGKVNGQPVNINCPVVNVDWWDAYAYARWKGRSLPTEEQWERAARGIDGRTYPWGNEFLSKAANLGDDFDNSGKAGGEKDGFNRWAPVDKIILDVSSCGACGLAGNVEEWTSTWVDHPDYPEKSVPVIRGGSFATKSSSELLTGRVLPRTPESNTEWRGFRTASSQPPSAP